MTAASIEILIIAILEKDRGAANVIDIMIMKTLEMAILKSMVAMVLKDITMKPNYVRKIVILVIHVSIIFLVSTIIITVKVIKEIMTIGSGETLIMVIKVATSKRASLDDW